MNAIEKEAADFGLRFSTELQQLIAYHAGQGMPVIGQDLVMAAMSGGLCGALNGTIRALEQTNREQGIMTRKNAVDFLTTQKRKDN